jgi:predicted transposase/invertase (TIGR01784 family)
MHQPHDKLFKTGFSDPETAAGFIRTQLPEELASGIDWKSLKLHPGTYIDSQFRQSESDLLFRAEFQSEPIHFYLLFEHQTTEDRYLALRLLRYMVRIWEGDIKKETVGDLPIILPIVLAQNDKIWTIKSNFTSLLNIPTGLQGMIQPYIPEFSFQLIQLAELPFDAIAGTPTGIMVLRVLKAERQGELLAKSVWDEALLGQIPQEMLELILRYILGADVDKEGFNNRITEIQQPETRTKAMTLAEQFRQEGRLEGLQAGIQKGRQEGRQEGIKEAILSYLKIRLGPVPEGLAEAVHQVVDLERLNNLQRASVTCASFEEFVKAL